MANLIFLCGSGTTGCHGWVESNRNHARELGFLVYRIDDPETVEFTDINGQSWLIKNSGEKVPT